MTNASTAVDSAETPFRTGPSLGDPAGRRASGAVVGTGRVVPLRRLIATMAVLLAPGCGGGGDEGANQPPNAVSPVADGASAQPGDSLANAITSPNTPNLPPLPKTEEVKRKEARDAAVFGAAAARSRLIIDSATSGRGRVVVSLGAPTTDDDVGYGSMFRNSILTRELVRQAMLIAARDELGLATRDEVLGDVVPTSSGGPSIQLGSFTTDDRGPNKANHAFVLRGDGERAERLLKVDLPCPYLPGRRPQEAGGEGRAALPAGFSRRAGQARGQREAESHQGRREAACRRRGAALAARPDLGAREHPLGARGDPGRR